MTSLHRLREQFQKFIEDDTLSHGYLLYGPDRDALLSFAKSIASYSESGVFAESPRHLSDALFLSGEASIGIDAVRMAKQFLVSRPAVGKRRIVVISQAEVLTPESQNALLKIAEEPPAKALLILLARSVEGLLPTLCSRFQKVAYSEGEEVTQEGPFAREAREFLNASPERRSALLKNFLERNEDMPEAIPSFLDALIIELYAHFPKSARSIGFLLQRKKLMEEVNTNPRLQLEAIAKIV